MGKLYAFVLGMALGLAMYHAAMHYQVVRASDGWHCVGKVTPRLSAIIVDIRSFTPAEWAVNPQLAIELQQAGLGGLMGDAVGNAVEQGIDQLLERLPPAGAAQPVP